MVAITKQDFRPAKPWGWLIALASILNRVRLPRRITLEIDPDDLGLFQALPQGCIIAPNHADAFDPQVTFELIRRAGRRVLFMSTRETFDACWGLLGWVLQRLGVFSVNRGGNNTEARQFALEVLVEGKYDLLMFPEGNVYFLNDIIMPLKPGVARFAIEAYEELVQLGQRRPIHIVPVAIKYRFTRDITAALEATTSGLEVHLFGRPHEGPLYPRIVDLGTELLARTELEYGVALSPGKGLFDRVRGLRQTILEGLERKYLGRSQAGFEFDRARKLIVRIQGFLATAHRNESYGLPTPQSKDSLLRDLEAAFLCARSVAFQEDYLLKSPTSERMAETLLKLERETLGGQPPSRNFGKRRAIIRIAQPLEVGEYLKEHKEVSSRDDLIEAMVARLHEDLQGTLDTIAREETQGENDGKLK